MVELTVVMLVLAILIAIAVPSFLTARDRAEDRAAQTNLRTALTTALAVYYDKVEQEFSDDAAILNAFDNTLTYSTVFTDPLPDGTVFVEVPPAGTYEERDTVYLATASKSGECFWVRNIGPRNNAEYARIDCSSVDAGDLTSLPFDDGW